MSGSGQGESSAEIREQIERQREQLAGSLERLESTVKRSFDLRKQIEERPMDALIIAIGTGFFLSSLFGGDSKSNRPPEQHEMSETLSLTLKALMGVGRQQVQILKGDAPS